MRTQRAMAVAAMIALAACSTEAITGVPGFLPPGGEPQGTQITTITGFVEIYSESDVRLVVAGSEIRLFGAIQEAARYGGAEVTVSGRYLSAGEFWVESVAPVLGSPATSRTGA